VDNKLNTHALVCCSSLDHLIVRPDVTLVWWV